jgi:serine/threonine protein kinase
MNDETSCLVLAYAGARTLARYIASLKSSAILVAMKLLNIVKQIMRGVAYLHRAGLVHGDIKPNNIVVSDYQRNNPIPRITIIDFDFSHPIKLYANDQVSLTPGLTTSQFMAPESFLFDKIDGRKQDMWAIGATIYFLLRRRSVYFGIKKEIWYHVDDKELFKQHMKKVRDDNNAYLDPVTNSKRVEYTWRPLTNMMYDCLKPRYENRDTPEEYIAKHRSIFA